MDEEKLLDFPLLMFACCVLSFISNKGSPLAPCVELL